MIEAMQNQPDGWIEWSGGECPVDREALVQPRFRSDSNEALLSVDRAGKFRWSNKDWASDIIAYRVIEPIGSPKITTIYRAELTPDQHEAAIRAYVGAPYGAKVCLASGGDRIGTGAFVEWKVDGDA